MTYIMAYDIGTTGLKTCLFEVDKTINMIGAVDQKYPLYVLPNGGVEQDGDDWWKAMGDTTREVLKQAGIAKEQISGISFCSQMQGLILVDRDGIPVHRPMSYMDQRSTAEIKKGIAYGPQIAGANIFKLIPSLIITGAVTSSVKDPVWKYKWLEAHEPEQFARAYKWLDVKDYIACRCTGRFTMTADSAFGTLIYDTRKGKEGWSKRMCSMFDINMDLLPEIIKSTDEVGPLTEKAAEELGLAPGTPVFGGGGDSSLIGVGAGCVNVGDTHIYSGTSGWVITVTDKQMVDTGAMIAAITGAQPGKFNYFAEMETAGKCTEWARLQLAYDDINLYPEKKMICDIKPDEYPGYYDYIQKVIEKVPAGSGGIIFTPWLHGNRCPFEDPNVTGTFLGVQLGTTKAEMIRAVYEGVFYHLRWMLECQDKKIRTSNPIRFVGGSALSAYSCQMLADITGRSIKTVASPQNVGSVGAAAVAAVGLGVIDSIESAQKFIPAVKIYEPNPEAHAVYEPLFQTFKKIYKSNKKLYKTMVPARNNESIGERTAGFKGPEKKGRRKA